jgi:hypothetical protein
LYDSVVSQARTGEANYDLPNFSVVSPFAVNVNGIHLKLKYAFNSAEIAKTGQWNFRSQSISAEVVVDSVEAHQIVHVVNGGSEVDIRLDGVCRNVRLTLPEGSSQATGMISVTDLQGHPRLLLSNFSANWKTGSWQIVDMNCQGPQGFGALVAQNAGEKLRNIDPFLNSIQTELQVKLDQGLNGPIALDMKNPAQPTEILHLSSPPFAIAKNGSVVMNGEALFHFSATSAQGCDAIIPGFKSEPEVKSSDNALTFPFSALRAILACEQMDHALDYTTDTSHIPAFQDLQQSFFKRNAVWPDLGNFENQAKFPLDAATIKTPLIKSPKAAGANTFTALVSLDGLISMKAPRDGTNVRYLKISTAFSGPSQIKVKSGKIQLKASTEAKLEASGEFDRSYLAKYPTDQRIDWPKLSEAVMANLTSVGLTMNLPRFAVSSAFTMVPKDGELLGQNFRLTFTMAKGKGADPQ